MSLTYAQKDVAQFMRTAGQTVRETPTVPEMTRAQRTYLGHVVDAMIQTAELAKSIALVSPSEQSLRVRLLTEELAELVEAICDGDLVGIADGTTDLSVVNIGTMCTFGLPAGPLWDEVHASNMSKFVDGKALKDASGKVIKGPGYFKADCAAVMHS
ncbi:MazG-like nucleotide pyrophosphohydrolase [Gordonia phage Octobien14]|uniref:MazG-like nucleotide pyrophosphohydrolase n=1 Tax=Gordonia phage Octobien14 TaxID=2483673 RepID=A0A3G3M9T5_9CAUD|nr:nucleotide pyrophosphohydrolase [Gordonia phage Octobien14]AYR03201.1 MazG-like nucleotide pyrophosphohydrolase [Gordonia phage Octobien14]